MPAHIIKVVRTITGLAGGMGLHYCQPSDFLHFSDIFR